MAKDDKTKPNPPLQTVSADAAWPESAATLANQSLPAIGETVHVCVMDGGVLTNEYGQPYPLEGFDVQVTSYVRRCLDRGDLIRL